MTHPFSENTQTSRGPLPTEERPPGPQIQRPDVEPLVAGVANRSFGDRRPTKAISPLAAESVATPRANPDTPRGRAFGYARVAEHRDRLRGPGEEA